MGNRLSLLFQIKTVFPKSTDVFNAVFAEVERFVGFVCRSYISVVIVEGLLLDVLVHSCEHPVPPVDVLGCLDEGHRLHESLELRVVEPCTEGALANHHIESLHD